MELKIGVAELAKALGRSQGIVEKKSTMPILSHVLLEAKKGDSSSSPRPTSTSPSPPSTSSAARS